MANQYLSHAHLISLLLLLSTLTTILASVSDFISIDCGAPDSAPYTDANNITWQSDANQIGNGESRAVQPGSNSLPKPMLTLRVFSTRNKNCYPIAVDGGGQVLVRASFYYGNYDKKSSPPTFALQFDGNSWATVVTSMDQVVYHEVVYVMTRNDTSVCVAQTKPGQLPFVSAIELRPLNMSLYGHYDQGFALFLHARIGFGALGPVRFPDDSYDRIWSPSTVTTGVTILAADSSIMDTSNITDNPPAKVLANAIQAKTVSGVITLGTNLPSATVPVYVNLYFAEMIQLKASQQRSFEIFVDGSSISDPIIPRYQTVDEYYIVNATANSSTVLSLTATNDSTLPAIISAMEVFVVSDLLTNGTDPMDMQGLTSLQEQFALLQDWSGDPCLPASYNWEWVACSPDPIPRITGLYLNGYNLSGEIPDFSTMIALQTIDMSNNSLTGGIPNYIGNLPNLVELKLADNKLNGSLPASLSNNKRVKLDISGNPSLCNSGNSCGSGTGSTPNSPGKNGSSGNKKISNLGLILGAIIPLFLL